MARLAMAPLRMEVPRAAPIHHQANILFGITVNKCKDEARHLDLGPPDCINHSELPTSPEPILSRKEVEEELAKLPHLPTASLVTLVHHLSSMYNPRLEQPPELQGLVDTLALHLHLLTYHQLEHLVASLAMWPEAPRHTPALRRVPDRLEFDIIRMFDLLKLESNRRLVFRLVGEGRHISLASRRFQAVLPLATLWATLDPLSTSPNSLTNSFHNNFVNHIGDSATGTSMSRFKHFTKDGFVSFMKLVEVVALMKTRKFHTYYCTIKFVDLFDQMDQHDIGAVCRAFAKKGIIHGSRHPMDAAMKGKIVAFLQEHHAEVTPANLRLMARVLRMGRLPAALEPGLLEVQEAVVAGGRLGELGLRPVLALLTVTQDTYSAALVDQWVRRALVLPLTRAGEDAVQPRDMADAGKLVALQRDTPAGRALLLRYAELLRDGNPAGFSEHFGAVAKSSVRVLLALAQLGLYPRRQLEALFTSPGLVTEVKGEQRLQRNILYGFKQGHKKSRDITGGLLASLVGMVELETGRPAGLHQGDLATLVALQVGGAGQGVMVGVAGAQPHAPGGAARWGGDGAHGGPPVGRRGPRAPRRAGRGGGRRGQGMGDLRGALHQPGGVPGAGGGGRGQDHPPRRQGAGPARHQAAGGGGGVGGLLPRPGRPLHRRHGQARRAGRGREAPGQGGGEGGAGAGAPLAGGGARGGGGGELVDHDGQGGKPLLSEGGP